MARGYGDESCVSREFTSSPTQPGYPEFTVQKAEVATSALHEMEVEAMMGIRRGRLSDYHL